MVPIEDRSAVAEVRRRAMALAQAAGFDDEAVARVAIVATELAGNVAKHGEGGHCFLSRSQDSGEELVQILAVDCGRGIEDPDRALQDGYSTAGTPGTGLGAVRRLSRSFDLFSQPGAGTVAVASVGPARATRSAKTPAPAPIEVGAVESPMPGEPVSGDSWVLERAEKLTTLLVTDGLGHGMYAAEASRAAVTTFRRLAGRRPAQRVEQIHLALRGTRGAAVAVAEIDAESERVIYAGIGNIAAQIVAGANAHGLVSLNGTAGQQARTIREFSYDFPVGALIVVHSDGVSARWTLDRYPGVTLRAPAVTAALLHRDYSRSRDDATVVVARHNPAPASAGDPEYR